MKMHIKEKSNSEKKSLPQQSSAVMQRCPTSFITGQRGGWMGAKEKEMEGEDSEEITGWALGPGLQRPHLARGGLSA